MRGAGLADLSFADDTRVFTRVNSGNRDGFWDVEWADVSGVEC